MNYKQNSSVHWFTMPHVKIHPDVMWKSVWCPLYHIHFNVIHTHSWHHVHPLSVFSKEHSLEMKSHKTPICMTESIKSFSVHRRNISIITANHSNYAWHIVREVWYITRYCHIKPLSKHHQPTQGMHIWWQKHALHNKWCFLGFFYK